jgi:hypothetical protein
MEVNILEAIKIQEMVYKETQRLKSYIEKEPDGNLKDQLVALLAGTEGLAVKLQDETALSLVRLPEGADKYIAKAKTK